MRDDLRAMAVAALVLFVMWAVGSAIIETVKAIASALS